MIVLPSVGVVIVVEVVVVVVVGAVGEVLVVVVVPVVVEGLKHHFWMKGIMMVLGLTLDVAQTSFGTWTHSNAGLS